MKVCPRCKKEVNEKELRTEINKIEFRTSYLCQDCQNDFFGPEEFFIEKEEIRNVIRD